MLGHVYNCQLFFLVGSTGEVHVTLIKDGITSGTAIRRGSVEAYTVRQRDTAFLSISTINEPSG